MIDALIKVIAQAKSDRAGTIIVSLFRILKHSKPSFEIMRKQQDFLGRIYQIEREYLDSVRRETSRITSSPNHSSIRSSVPSDNRVVQTLLDRRSRQVSLIQDGNHEVFCRTIYYESDEECDIDPAAKEIDIRDKDEQWKRSTLKRNFGDMIEFFKFSADGSKAQDYLMNAEDRIAPLGTATVEYGHTSSYS